MIIESKSDKKSDVDVNLDEESEITEKKLEQQEWLKYFYIM